MSTLLTPRFGGPQYNRGITAKQAAAFARDGMERAEVLARRNVTHGRGCGCPKPKCLSAQLLRFYRDRDRHKNAVSVHHIGRTEG